MQVKISLGSRIRVPANVSHYVINRTRALLTWTDPSVGFKSSRGWYVNPESMREIKGYTKKDGNYFLPRGFLERFELMLQDEGVQYQLEDKRTWWKPHPYHSNIDLRPHQIKPVIEMMKWNEGILQAPPGSGKSIMMLELACRWGQPTLILAHTERIMEQWQEYIVKFTNQQPGLIVGKKFDIQNITVGSVMTLANRTLDMDFRSYFGVVILDEAHHAPAFSFKTVLGQFSAHRRLGVTATPRRSDGLQGLLSAVVGPVRAQVPLEELFRTGYAIRPTVYKVPTQFKIGGYAEKREDLLFAAIEEDVPRAKVVAQVALENKNRSTLVLSRRIAHLDLIADYIFEEDPGAKMEVLTGRLNSKDRQKIVRRLRKGKLNIVLATQLADEGLDIERLDTILLAFPSSGETKLEQQMGRTMRSFPGKKDVRVYDFMDLKVPRLAKQALKRGALYRRLLYPTIKKKVKV